MAHEIDRLNRIIYRLGKAAYLWSLPAVRAAIARWNAYRIRCNSFSSGVNMCRFVHCAKYPIVQECFEHQYIGVYASIGLTFLLDAKHVHVFFRGVWQQ